MPERIQRTRKKDFKMPCGTVYVGRPGPFGNPYKVGETRKMPDGTDLLTTAENCLEWFEEYLNEALHLDPDWLSPLRGKHLACWCRLGRPCHADVLLRRANA